MLTWFSPTFLSKISLIFDFCNWGQKICKNIPLCKVDFDRITIAYGSFLESKTIATRKSSCYQNLKKMSNDQFLNCKLWFNRKGTHLIISAHFEKLFWCWIFSVKSKSELTWFTHENIFYSWHDSIFLNGFSSGNVLKLSGTNHKLLWNIIA